MSSSVYEDAGAALRQDPLYVDPAALSELEERGNTFDQDAQAAVRDILEEAETPVRLAVLPMSSETGSNDEAGIVANATGRDGTYVVIFPDGSGSTATNTAPSTAVTDAAGLAMNNSDDLEGFAAELVDRVESLAAGDGAAGRQSNGQTSDGGSGYIPLAILLAAGGGGFLLYRRRQRQRETAQLNEVRLALDQDITAYGEELTALDLDVRTDDVPEQAQREYAEALDLYEHAKSAADRAEKPDDLRPVTTSLEHGRWLLACVRARINGEELPERRPPCFFDPRHGPSVEDVTWTPPGGVPREVPACRADAVRVREGRSPESRLVTVDGDERPYWDAGPAYAAWAGGYFGGFMPGMLMGTMLGTAMAPGFGAMDAGAGGFDGGGFGGGFDGGGFDGGGFDIGGFDGGF